MGKGREMEVERDFTLGDGHSMQYTDDVLLYCSLENFMVLPTNTSQ